MKAIFTSVTKEVFGADLLTCAIAASGAAGGVVYKITITKSPYTLAVKTAKNGELLRRECESIRFIKGLADIKLPIIYYESYSESLNYVVMEYFDGVNCTDTFLLDAPKKTRQNVARQIADNLIELQKVKGDKYGDLLNPEYDSWHDYFHPFVNELIKDGEKLCKYKILKKFILDALKMGESHYDEIFSEPISAPTLIHGDYWAQNLIIDRNFKLIGVVDPFNSMWGDCEYELFALNAVCGNRLPILEAYLSKVKVSEKFMLKNWFYYMVSEIYWVKKLHHDNNPLLTHIVRKFKSQYHKFITNKVITGESD